MMSFAIDIDRFGSIFKEVNVFESALFNSFTWNTEAPVNSQIINCKCSRIYSEETQDPFDNILFKYVALLNFKFF